MEWWQLGAFIVAAVLGVSFLAIALYDWQVKAEQHDYDKHKED